MPYKLLSICVAIFIPFIIILSFLGYAKFVFKILSPVLAIMLGLMMWLKGGSLIWIFILPIVSYVVYLRLNYVMTNEKLKKE